MKGGGNVVVYSESGVVVGGVGGSEDVWDPMNHQVMLLLGWRVGEVCKVERVWVVEEEQGVML